MRLTMWPTSLMIWWWTWRWNVVADMEMDKVADTKSSRPEGLPARSRGPQDLYNLYMKEMFFFFILSKIVFSRQSF